MNLIYINEKEERKKLKKWNKKELINEILQMKEDLEDAKYETMGEDL